MGKYTSAEAINRRMRRRARRNQLMRTVKRFAEACKRTLYKVVRPAAPSC